jgi:excisionase family DNA binding protein
MRVTAKQMQDAINFVRQSFNGDVDAAIKAIKRIDDKAVRDALIAYKQCADTIDSDSMMRVPDVARRLSFSVAKVYRLISTGKLGHYKIDHSIRVGDEHLAAFLAASQREPKDMVPAPLPKRPRRKLKFL